MHHIPLVYSEICALSRACATAPETWDVAAIVSASQPGFAGLTVISLTNDQRKRVESRLSAAHAAQHSEFKALIKARDATEHKLLREISSTEAVGSTDCTRQARAHPEYLASCSAAEVVAGICAETLNLKAMFGPMKPDKERVCASLNAIGIRTGYRGHLTDAASQLFDAAGGCWTSRDLRGKAGKYAGHYVRRRRRLAAAAQGLGMGQLVVCKHQRIEWEWARAWLTPPANRRPLPGAPEETFTPAEEAEIASLAI